MDFRKQLLVFVVLGAVTITFSLFYYDKIWLLSSEKLIRKSLLYQIPIGTQLETVENFIKEKNYKVDYISTNGNVPDKQDCATIGSSNIRTTKPSIQVLFIFHYTLTIFWIFDNQNTLVEIVVWKDIDSL